MSYGIPYTLVASGSTDRFLKETEIGGISVRCSGVDSSDNYGKDITGSVT